MSDRLTVNEVANKLKVSVSWVYAHAHLIGTKVGGIWFFYEEGINDAIRRRDPVERDDPPQRFRGKGNKTTGRAMGKGPGAGNQEKILESARRHGLINIHGQVSR